MPRDSTYVPSNSSGSVGGETDTWSETDSVDTVIRLDPFECRGDGLLVDGFPCETPARLKELLKPESPGLVPILNHERPKKWWRAQCLHYDIRVPANATINTYRVYLGNAIPHQLELTRPRERIILEDKLNQAYHDAKSCGKGEVDMVPTLTLKRRTLDLKFKKRDVPVEGKKRICVADHSTSKRSHGQINLNAPRFSYLDVLRQHELNMFIGTYNLKLDETSPIIRSGHAPTLIIAAGFDQLRFEGSIKLPGIMSCALVFELASLSKQNERQYITVRFKWRGKVANKEAAIPDPSQVGELTLDMEHRRVKGSIDGPIRAGFKGFRINSAQRELLHRWEDLDVILH